MGLGTIKLRVDDEVFQEAEKQGVDGLVKLGAKISEAIESVIQAKVVGYKWIESTPYPSIDFNYQVTELVVSVASTNSIDRVGLQLRNYLNERKKAYEDKRVTSQETLALREKIKDLEEANKKLVTECQRREENNRYNWKDSYDDLMLDCQELSKKYQEAQRRIDMGLKHLSGAIKP